MGRNVSYPLSPSLPHIPADILSQRLARHSTPADNGCVLWRGHRHSTSRLGMLRVTIPGGGTRLIYARKAAWFLAHGTYPVEPQILVSICGEAACINADHLDLRSRADARRLTDDQVAEARALFWLPHCRLTAYQRRAKAPSAEQLAAWALGLHPRTVAQVVAGRRVQTAKWRGAAQSREEVLAMVARHQHCSERRREARAEVWTCTAVAARYGLSLACTHRMLHGYGYAHVPMPPESDRRQQEDGRRRAREEFSRGSTPGSEAPAAGEAAPVSASVPAG